MEIKYIKSFQAVIQREIYFCTLPRTTKIFNILNTKNFRIHAKLTKDSQIQI